MELIPFTYIEKMKQLSNAGIIYRHLGKDVCIPNPCKNEGKCFTAENRIGYHCVCQQGKRGLHCERKKFNVLNSNCYCV